MEYEMEKDEEKKRYKIGTLLAQAGFILKLQEKLQDMPYEQQQKFLKRYSKLLEEKRKKQKGIQDIVELSLLNTVDSLIKKAEEVLRGEQEFDKRSMGLSCML